MEKSINLSDFKFVFSGHGHYKVTYTSPVTSKSWTTITSNMPLIDVTKNAENPKKKDLVILKRICKSI
jgi:hypothetical protein